MNDRDRAEVVQRDGLVGAGGAQVWRKVRLATQVNCPATGHPAVVDLDVWYAVKTHTLGNDDKRVRRCSEWPKCSPCKQECLVQLLNPA